MKDKAKWDWEKSGTFSVKSLYKHLCRNNQGQNYKYIWQTKIFMWLLLQNAILTKDNLTKRNRKGRQICASEHLFFGCTTAKYIWSLIACALGVSCRPCNIDQFWVLEYLFPTCTCRLLQAGLALWATLYPLFICNPLVISSLSESKPVGIPLSRSLSPWAFPLFERPCFPPYSQMTQSKVVEFCKK